jgi:sulfite exporter TauE/SafE/copper chaperone CopZ
MQELRLNIEGMSCAHCEQRIEAALLGLSGVATAQASLLHNAAVLIYDPLLLPYTEIVDSVEKLGYIVIPSDDSVSTLHTLIDLEPTSVSAGDLPPIVPLAVGASIARPEQQQPLGSGRSMSAPTTKQNHTRRFAGAMILIVALFVLIQMFGASSLVNNFPLVTQDMGYVMLFAIGALTSLHCLFMCGGINLSVCLPQGETSATGKAALRPSLLYNLGRVVGYTAVGALVGALGSVLTLSGSFKGIIQLLAGVFMVWMGLSMLGVLPTIRMPFKALDLSAQKSKGPLVVGLLNALMPCGPLQAMQLYALSTGSILVGALSMMLFALGTVPLMLILGALGGSLSRRFTTRAMHVGAVLVCVLGLFMFSTGLTLSGFTNPIDRMLSGGGNQTAQAGEAVVADGWQVVDSTLGRRYPDITVAAGMPVRWIITASEDAINGCNNRMSIPEYGIEYSFKPGENVIEFTPTETGTFTYSCWMGMIKATITVI